MTWTYDVATGNLTDAAGELEGTGYSGHGEGLNNSAAEAQENVGPIPRGRWLIGTWQDKPHLGPCVASLTPALGTVTFGRSGFFIHGDNAEGDHSASDGCIILNALLRHAMKASGDNVLVVY